MNRGAKLLGTLFGVALCTGAVADDDDLPNEAFLEFLGSWDTGDGAWQEFFDSLPDELPELAGTQEDTGRKASDVTE